MYTEAQHQHAIENYRAVESLITKVKKGTVRMTKDEESRLHEVRELLFIKIEMSTCDHVLALYRLKKELNLHTDYGRA